MKMLLVILSLVFSAIYLLVIYMEWDRTIGLNMSPYERYIEEYKFKPLASEQRRVIVLLKDHDISSPVPDNTFKSILDQSVRVNGICVQTLDPGKYKHLRKILTTHVPDTEHISEGEETTIIIPIKAGDIYPYDFVETMVR